MRPARLVRGVLLLEFVRSRVLSAAPCHRPRVTDQRSAYFVLRVDLLRTLSASRNVLMIRQSAEMYIETWPGQFL